MNNLLFEKKIIAPQIVVYRNIFNSSKEVIKILEDNDSNSLISKWRDWYDQGYRKDSLHINLYESVDQNSEVSLNQKKQIKEISNIINIITKDYFNQFEKENGEWPSFIEDWESLKKEKDTHEINFFKYDLEKNKDVVEDTLLMQYHIDEIPVAIKPQIIDDRIELKKHVITINFYLNDNYTGGEICAYSSVNNKSYRYKPKQGDIVVMPSGSPFYHAVKSFRGSDRYFLRSFIDYKIEPSEEWNKEYSINGDEMISQINKNIEKYINDDLQNINVNISEELIEWI
jgi:hypothetical protein